MLLSSLSFSAFSKLYTIYITKAKNFRKPTIQEIIPGQLPRAPMHSPPTPRVAPRSWCSSVACRSDPAESAVLCLSLNLDYRQQEEGEWSKGQLPRTSGNPSPGGAVDANTTFERPEQPSPHCVS